jgi:hypothetical protein
MPQAFLFFAADKFKGIRKVKAKSAILLTFSNNESRGGMSFQKFSS